MKKSLSLLLTCALLIPHLSPVQASTPSKAVPKSATHGSKKAPPAPKKSSATSLSLLFVSTPPIPKHLSTNAASFLSPNHLQAFNTWWKSQGMQKSITFKQQHAYLQRPIASVTKLMLAAVSAPLVLHGNPLGCSVTLLEQDRDRVKNTFSQLPENISYTCQDILSVVLTRSDNQSANALARTLFGSHESAVKHMNALAKKLHLSNTHFVDPAGLRAQNHSSAYDLAKLLVFLQTLEQDLGSYSTHTFFKINPRSITFLEPTDRLPPLEVATPATSLTQSVTVKNTNKLVRRWDNLPNTPHILLSKTGFTNEAGRCLVMSTRFSNGTAHFIVLGSKVPGEREQLIESWIQSYTQGSPKSPS